MALTTLSSMIINPTSAESEEHQEQLAVQLEEHLSVSLQDRLDAISLLRSSLMDVW